MQQLLDCSKLKFNNTSTPRIFFSPGRVNIIGEHIDYNGGTVFPAAISLGTYGVVYIREDQTWRFYSSNFKSQGIVEVNMGHLGYESTHGWVNYAKGIIYELIQRNHALPFGFDLYVEGNLPPQSGLSSSASLEVLVCYICNTLYNLNLSRLDIALIGMHVENNYMGMHCGIMDQLIIASGTKDHGFLMNTHTYEMKKTNAFFSGYNWLIMNTNYQRKTTDSKYNDRVSECNTALKIIQKEKVITHLCELSVFDLLWVKPLIDDLIIYNRVKHVITEQERTLKAKIAMENGDYATFAQLLNQSHESLKEDYDVTGIHLDALVDEARKHGAIGARMTGAGFGGCAIALVPKHLVNYLINNVTETYFNKTKIKPSFYQVSFEDGVKEIMETRFIL